jgi:hypothetical protein
MCAGSVCPREGAKCEFPLEKDIALAALADEDVSVSAISRCLRPDKPATCACSVCRRERAKCKFPLERDIVVAALVDEDVSMSAISR